VENRFQNLPFKCNLQRYNTKVKPFIPDYIPAIGDIDEFIKVPRPDGKPDDLGLKVLDEPSAKQSDSTVLQLQLRHTSKQSNLPKLEVGGCTRRMHLRPIA
jgi:intraflagellar transport protein 46